ncbi:MAG: ATP-binding protein [Pseudomonadota bacterium]|nr:ATP-binding protein [Pseudomonadota bacterium]
MAEFSKNTDIEHSPKGLFKLFIGVMPHSGKVLQMLNEVTERYESGETVYVSSLNPNYHAHKTTVNRMLKNMNQSLERLAHEDVLSNPEALDGLIEAKPNIVAIGTLIPQGCDTVKERITVIDSLLEAGIDVYACLDTFQIEGVATSYSKPFTLSTSQLLFRSTVLSADKIEIVDTSVLTATKTFKRLPLKRYPIIQEHIKTFVQPEWTEHNRQIALSFALEHAVQHATVSNPNAKSYFSELTERFKSAKLKTIFFDTCISILTVFICTFVLHILEKNFQTIPALNALVYMTGMVSVALFTGLYAGLMSGFMAYLAYNFFFMKPLHTFLINEFSDIAIAIVFVFCSILVNVLTHAALRKTTHFQITQTREHTILSDYLNKLVNTQTSSAVLDIFHKTLKNDLSLKNTVCVLTPEQQFEYYGPYEEILTEERRHEIENALLKQNQKSIQNAVTWIFETEKQPLGIVIFDEKDKNEAFKQKALIDKLTKITISLAERYTLEKTIQETLIANEREKLRSALLSSISHDLKTPLVGIVGSLSTVKSYGDSIDKEDRDDLIDSAINEANRLNQFISNILDISKIEAGALSLKQGWHPLLEMAHNTLGRFKGIASTHNMQVSTMLGDDVTVYVDPVLLGQVLFNLVDNALKYAGKSAEITLQIEPEKSGGVFISVIDNGKGLDENAISHLFDKFYRAEKQDSQTGTGLGLAIAHGIMEAHSGSIKAFNRKDGTLGAVFQLFLPKEHVEYE